MGYETISLIVIALIFALLYIKEDKGHYLIKQMFLMLCLIFMCGALALQVNLGSTTCIQHAAAVNGSTLTNCTYTYSLNLVNTGTIFIIPLVVLAFVAALFFIQFLKDLFKALKPD